MFSRSDRSALRLRKFFFVDMVKVDINVEEFVKLELYNLGVLYMVEDGMENVYVYLM